MKNIFYAYLCILLMLVTLDSCAQRGKRAKYISYMSSEPGKCYAKCFIPDQTESNTKYLPKYTGPVSDIDKNPNIVAMKFTQQIASSHWEKKRADKNCLSRNPDDCLVYCLVEVPEISKIEYIVKDTSLTKSYQWQEFYSVDLVQKGYTGWVEVICDRDITILLIKKVQTALSSNGFYDGEIDGVLSSTIRSKLSAFQKKKGLAVGGLTFETMNVLGVKP
ncbi:MAG: peptidoglycan-binding protein [Saprospiraceae bacterium]|nr:peptidoglycan-binding protein [Saprospiraceae bacterium]